MRTLGPLVGMVSALVLATQLAAPAPLLASGAQPSSPSAARIAKDLRALCSVEAGRVPGTPGYEEALEYSERTLRELGLPPRRQEVVVHRFLPDTLRVDLVDADSKISGLTLHSLGASGGALAGGYGLLDLGAGTPAELGAAAPSIPGRVVLMEPTSLDQEGVIHRLEKLDRAAAAGAAGVIFLSPLLCEIQGVVAWEGLSRIPAFSGPHVSTLREELTSNPSLTLTIRDDAKGAWRQVPSANLIAEMKGTNPAARQILVSAHLDAWNLGQGALDNGAGVCVLLESARLLRAQLARVDGARLERTIRFVLFTGEELGLEGSRAYLKRVEQGEESAPAAVLNLEMCESPAGFVVHSGAGLTLLLNRLVLEHRDLGLDQGVVQRLDLYSDHMPFLLAGYPSFTLSYHRGENSRERIHTKYDRVDAIDPEGLARSAELVAEALWALTRDGAPVPPRLDESALRGLFARSGMDLDRVREKGY
ncbi:MAG TPA: M28 family metallopeptidase [Candidatus Krumholzibacteria bacterium]|nr:M28 family metallopeptidase [Candidatus Krumholzibacteria bacterium]